MCTCKLCYLAYKYPYPFSTNLFFFTDVSCPRKHIRGSEKRSGDSSQRFVSIYFLRCLAKVSSSRAATSEVFIYEHLNL